MNDTVGTEELERQWRIATRPAPDDVTEEMAREVFEACDYLAEMSEDLAAEVLAGRKRDIATRKALRDLKWASKDLWVDGKLRHVPMSVGEMAQLARAALAAMEVPDGE